MADYSSFDTAIVPWLKKVWQDKAQIEQAVRIPESDAQTDAAAAVLKGESVQVVTAGQKVLTQLKRDSRKEGAWQVYDRYNDPTPAKENLEAWQSFLKHKGKLVSKYGISGDPQTRKEIPNDFYHFGAGCRQGKGMWRIYVHITNRRKNWIRVIDYCLSVMTKRRLEDIEKCKVAGPGLSKDRGDQVVIWVNSEAVKDSTLEALKKMSDCFGGSVPPGVKQVVPGLGWGVEPAEAEHGSPAIDEVWDGEGVSFGSYLAAVIYMALEQSWHKTEDGYVEELVQFFLNVGVDPKNPHLLRTYSWEQVKQMTQVSNAKLVTSGVSASSTVFTDRTNMLPTVL